MEEKKDMTHEAEDPKPLTDEEFKEWKKKDEKKTKKTLGILSAIWDIFHFFT